MMDKVTFLNDILNSVRQRFRYEQNLDNREARRIIIEEIFNDGRSRTLNDEELEEFICRIFYKTTAECMLRSCQFNYLRSSSFLIIS